MFDYIELKPMALESSSSWIAQEHQKNSEQQQFITNSVNSQQRHSSKTSSKHHTQTERFTQTEYRANCAEVVATSHKDSVMFEQTVHQPQAVPVQIYSTIEKKDIAQDKANVTEFPFCYNVNMLQKVHQTQSGGPTAAAVATISNDDKACYRFDVAQPFGYNYALVNQMSLAAAASTATFKCDICGLVFAHLSLLNHHKRIHNNSSDISPERTFSNEQQPIGKSNNKTGTMEKSRSCNRCGGEVVDCEHSNNGKKKVSKYVKCENCQAGPTSTTTTTTTNGSFPTSPPEPTGSPSEIVTVSSKGLQLVKRHGLATVTKCHKCNGSGIIFVGGTQPPSTPDKPFRCNLCDGSFSRYSSLWSHKRLHSGDKPFKCELCGLTFARAAYLKNHIRVHSGEKPYKCNVCGMQFSQSPHLKNHERIHSGERPYQCEVCQKTFARHSTLWNHRRIHTGEKPYRCTVCGSAFNQATHLKNHAKVHTGEKPHHCDICEVGFSDRFALKRHKLIHEKYGRTSGNSQSQAQPTSNSQNQQTGTQMGDMYKCEVAFPGQQPNASSNSQSQQTTQLEMYKCEVATSVAFPLPRQALQTNSGRAQQQTDVPVYKCDDGTTVTFPVQQQAQQPTQSNTSTPQTTQITEVYKVDVGNNTLSYPNQPNQQQNGSNPSLSQQQSSQMNDMYKYDVETSVPFPGQSQQSTTQQSNSSTNSQQISQYDIGNSTASFSSQAQQNQQTSSQPHSAPQQIAEIKTGSFTREPESILGSRTCSHDR